MKKDLEGSQGEFNVRDKARQWDQSWPGVLFQAGDLYSVHLFMLLFLLLSGCDPGFLLSRSGKKIDNQKESDLFPNAMPFPRPVHGKQEVGCMVT